MTGEEGKDKKKESQMKKSELSKSQSWDLLYEPITKLYTSLEFGSDLSQLHL